MMQKLAVATVVASALTLASGVASAGRFSTGYSGTNQPGATTCYQQQIYVSCPSSGGYALQILAPSTCDECTMQGGSWDGNYCTTTQCYTSSPYIYSSQVAVQAGDIILWGNTGEFSLALITTGILAPAGTDLSTMKIHAGACYYSSGSNCTTIWNSTAALDQVVSAANATNVKPHRPRKVRAFRKALANQLTHLLPGLSTAAPMSAPELKGAPTIFKPLDSALRTYALNNMGSHVGAGSGGSYYYSLGTYSEYTPYGACSESVSDAYGLYVSEGKFNTCIPVNVVSAIAQAVHKLFFHIVRYGSGTMNGQVMRLNGYSGLPKNAKWLISQGGRDGVATALANAVINAFMNRPGAQDTNPFGGLFSAGGTIHAINGVTSPMNIYLALMASNGAGGSSTCVSPSPTIAYNGDTTVDGESVDDEARNNGANGGATEYGYQGTSYNFGGALSTSIVTPSYAGYCSSPNTTTKCEADSDCWAVGGTSATCIFPLELGRIGYWYGKVNIHQAPGGSWLRDNDCSSGANLDPLTYCRKFWPSTTSVTATAVTAKTSAGNIWYTAGCSAAYAYDGQNEYVCQ